jgi:hypothetical protein
VVSGLVAPRAPGEGGALGRVLGGDHRRRRNERRRRVGGSRLVTSPSVPSSAQEACRPCTWRLR